jgi:chromosome partitioning protein
MIHPAQHPPFTIAVVNSKGGVGKTTSSVLIADLIGSQVGPTLLIDLDTQASATGWARVNELAGRPLRCATTQVPTDIRPAMLARHIHDVGATVEWLVLDTPPSDMERFDAAIEAAVVNGGMALVPTSPSDLDLARVDVTMGDIAGRVPVVTLLTQAATGSIAARQARSQLVDAGYTVLATEVAFLQAMVTAMERPLDERARRDALSPIELYEPVVAELLTVFAGLQAG